MNKLHVILGKGYVGTQLASCLTSFKQPNILLEKNKCNYTDEAVFTSFIETAWKTKLANGETPSKIIVINCAGYTGVPNVDECETPSVQSYVMFLNALLPVRLARVCQKTGCQLIHISSGCIFDGYEKVFKETDEPNFGIYNKNSSFYSKTKHLGEIGLRDLGFGNILRVRMIFGDVDSPRNFLTKIRNYRHLIVKENSMTNVDDLSLFITKFIESNLEDNHDIWHVCNTGSISLKVIAAMTEGTSLHKNWGFVKEEDLQTIAPRSNCVLSTTKIMNEFMGLPPVNHSLEKCIQKIAANVV